MEDIVFVVLHYLTTDITKNCVEHVEKNCDTKKYKIIIVDNNSPNNSYEELKELYEKDDKIILIRNEENLGFARGNNVGFMYAKNNLTPKFIALINNDIFIKDENLFQKLSEEYDSSGFAVAGPKVYLPDGSTNSNPFIPFIPTVEWFSYMIKKRNWEMFWAFFGLYEKVCPFVNKILKKINICQEPECKKVVEARENLPLSDMKCYGVGLHGCCLFFSETYIKRYDGLCDKTYMGGEEMILFVQMLCDDSIMVYLPTIEVLHLEGIASKAGKKRVKKKRMPEVFKHSRYSYIVSKEILRKSVIK